jgi:arsenate reductase (glutaredoxin)
LRKTGLELTEINYATGKTPLTESAVRDVVKRAGSVAAVLNTRHAVAKEHGWVDRPPSAAEFAKAVVSEPNLLRRPILVIDERVIVGFDKPAYAKLK